MKDRVYRKNTKHFLFKLFYLFCFINSTDRIKIIFEEYMKDNNCTMVFGTYLIFIYLDSNCCHTF